MNRLKVSMIALATGLLAGCLTAKGPPWLEAGEVDMASYTRGRVLILPVEVSPPYVLESGELRTIQDQVKNSLVKVFDLEVVESLRQESRIRAYPYQLEELTETARLYNADAVAAISVYSLARDSANLASRIGIRITFTDGKDPNANWTLAHDYGSDSGFAADSSRFENSLFVDFLAVKNNVRAGPGFTGFLKDTLLFGFLWDENPDAPRVTITASTGDANPNEPPLAVDAPISTEQSKLQFQIQAEDPAGLLQTTVRNRRSGWSNTLVHTLPGAKRGDAPRHVDEVIAVPLEFGENRIEFVTTNQMKLEAPNAAEVTRVKSESVYALSVGIDQYQYYDQRNAQAQQLADGLVGATQQKQGNVTTLVNRDATQREIQRQLYELSAKTSYNEQSLGVFYFAGTVRATKGGIFLVAYDSEPQYVEVTGIDVAMLGKALPQDGVVMLDLCQPDTGLQGRLREALPKALISFDSCEGGVNRIGDRLMERTAAGKTLREAIESVSAEFGP